MQINFDNAFRSKAKKQRYLNTIPTYPDKMVKEILLGIRETAAEQDPMRFGQPSRLHVMVTRRTSTPEAWEPVFESAQRIFETTRQRNYVLPVSDPTWKMVRDLAQWHRLERVQIAHQPAMLRLPLHVPHTHRGWALRYNDGSTEIVEEDLADIRHPRARFRKPVDIGVFYYGYADADHPTAPPAATDDQGLREDDPRSIISHNYDGISFPKMPGLDCHGCIGIWDILMPMS